MKFWRHPAADGARPSRDALTAWLYEQWQVLDDWVGRCGP